MSVLTVLSDLVGTMVAFFETQGGLDSKQTTTPSNPTAGRNRIYPKSDKKWYTLDSDGNEVLVGPDPNVNADWNASTGAAQILNKPTTMAPASHGNDAHSATFITSSGVTYEALNGNSDVGTSSGQVAAGDHGHSMDALSDGETYVRTHNDFTDAEQSKLSGIASGAEANVNADWNSDSGDSQILNKPTTMTPSSHGHAATEISAAVLGTPTYDDVQDYINSATSAGRISGGVLAAKDATHITVTAVKCMIRTTNSATGQLVFADVAANTNLAIEANLTNYIYVDYNSGSPVIAATTDRLTINKNTQFVLGAAYTDGAETPHVVTTGMNVNNWATDEHSRIVECHRVQRASGCVVSEKGTRNIATTEGVIYVAGVRQTPSAKDTSGTDKFTYVYQKAGGGWTFVEDQTQINNTQYDNGTGTLADLTANRYGIHWVFILYDGDLYVKYGIGDYTLAQAQAAQLPGTLPDELTSFGTVAAKIIIQKSASSFTSIISAYTTTFGTASPTDHNNLANLQGGTTGNYYHFRKYADITAAKAGTGSDGNICYVISMDTWYRYLAAGGSYTADDQYILITGDGGNTRWYGVAGQYSYYVQTRFSTTTGHDHDNSDSKKVSYNNLDNIPSTFAPASHSNTAHSDTYITSDGVTYENLNGNSDVGTGSAQVAKGDHTHAAVETDISQLENSLIMLAWDTYAADNTYDDIYTDDLSDETGIDTGASTYTYDSANDWVEYVAAVTGGTTSIDPATAADVTMKDLKGTIGYWEQTSTGKGYFKASAGGAAVSIGAGGTETAVVIGTLITFADTTTATIWQIVDNGETTDKVWISTDHADSNVTSITGLVVTGGTVAVNSYTSTSTTGTDSAGDTNITAGYSVVRAGNALPNGEYITKVGLYTSSTTGTYKFFIALDNGTNSLTGTYVGESFTNKGSAGFQEFDLATPLLIPVTGSYYPGAYCSSTTADAFATSGGSGRWYVSGDKSASTATYTLSASQLVHFKFTTQKRAYNTGTAYVAHSNDSIQVDCSLWSDLNSAVVTQTAAGSTKAYHAWSRNKENAAETWWCYRSGDWRNGVKLDSGTWKYLDNAEAWQNASPNSRLGALAQALALTDNQWTKAEVDAMTDSNWNETDGWSDADTQLDWAVYLQANGTDIPSWGKTEFNYDSPVYDITLVTNSWEASANDPTDAYCVMEIIPGEAITLDTDLKAWVSMDDGANYEQITGLEIFREIGTSDFVRGDITGLTARTDKTMVLKITSHNSKNVSISAVALGVKY